jgi:cytosine deaminase
LNNLVVGGEAAMFDLILRNAVLPGRSARYDLGLKAGRIAVISASLPQTAPSEDLCGRLLSPGLVDSHIHLDKACILDRCPICMGTLAEAVQLTSAAKAEFNEEDVYARAASVVERAISHGTQRMRSFVEVDPRVGLRAFRALQRIKTDYAHAVDIQLCAFAQEGLTQEMATYDLLNAACEGGADLVGGCPYTDPNPVQHVQLIFDLAQRFDLDVDFHLDFDLQPGTSNLPSVISATEARNYGGRVSIGHVTQLSAQSPYEREMIAKRLSAAGISLTVLPATDLFLLGREYDQLIPRGVTPAHRMKDVVTTLATNNVLNPFTPFGDASLIRMANLYANVTQAAQDEELLRIFSMITSDAARSIGGNLSLSPGMPADFILLDAGDPVSAIREIAPALAGWKAGRKTFERPAPRLFGPAYNHAPDDPSS